MSKQKVGTNYGGWVIPSSPDLQPHHTAICIGAGEDISFDLLLQHTYGLHILIIDPTLRAKRHFTEMEQLFQGNITFDTLQGDIQPDYQKMLQNIHPDFSSISFIEVGVSDSAGTVKFFKQINPKYVSQSLESNMFGNDFDIVKVDTISSIMQTYNVSNVQLIKMDIEGSELKVLQHMIDHHIFPKYLLVEFDLYIKKKDPKGMKTKHIIKTLLQTYTIFHNENFNITFIRKE